MSNIFNCCPIKYKLAFRLAKDDAIFDALGAVDTLSSHIGLSRVHCKQDEISVDLKNIQCNLQDLGDFLLSNLTCST